MEDSRHAACISRRLHITPHMQLTSKREEKVLKVCGAIAQEKRYCEFGNA